MCCAGVARRDGRGSVAMTEHALVIVGGGPTGLMLAGELALAPEWGYAAPRSGPFLEQHGGWGSGVTLRHSLENARWRGGMGCYVLDFQEIDQTQVAVVGGKGANLGGLSRMEGLGVPAGFCVTTDAFQRIMAEAPSIDDRLDRLSRLEPDHRQASRALSAEMRRT